MPVKADLAYFGRLFGLLAGDGDALAICDASGRLVWSANGPDPEPLRGALARARREGLSLDDTGTATVRYDLEGDGTLLLQPLAWRGEGRGSLLLHTRDGGVARAGELSALLSEIARGIEREATLNSELDSLTEELSDRYEELNLIYHLGHFGMKDFDAPNPLTRLVQLCMDYIEADIAVYVDSVASTPLWATSAGFAIRDIDFLLIRLQSDVHCFASSSRQTVIINDDSDTRRPFVCADLPYKLLAVPILVDDRVRSSLIILRGKQSPDFDLGDRKLMEVIAEHIGHVIHNHDLYLNLKRFTEQMATALIRSVDAKDPYTRGHSERVNRYSVEIGKQMELPTDRSSILFWASLLHDLGKLGVPDVILTKPARLTDDEFFFIKEHPARGEDILVPVQSLLDALPGIRHHHERFDGTGYPDGLRGKGIPVISRVIAVADTYDALTSSRSYRPSCTHEAAMAEIRRVAGTQLDPDVIDAWCQVVEENPELISHVLREDGDGQE